MMNALARRYARAAVAAVAEGKTPQGVDVMAANMQAVAQAYANSAELREALANPVFNSAQSQVLAAVLKVVGADTVTTRLVQLLARNNRIQMVTEVAEALVTLADASANRVRALVKSAVPVTDAQKTRIAQALKKRLGQDVVVSVQIDPTIIGGLTCQVGNFTLDSSLKRQLEILTERLGAQAH